MRRILPVGAATVALAATVAATPAEAHLVQSGLGPFHDGLAHLALSPDDLLLAAGVALFAGLCGRRAGRIVLFALPAAWLLGGLAGMRSSAVVSWPLAAALSLVAIGLLVAWRPRVPDAATGLLAAGLGALHGYMNGTLAAAGGFGVTNIVGIGSGVFVLVALLAALTVSLRSAWAPIVVRVAGSWIGAIGILMAAWALR